jgi:8-oxo-dGTP diphosphatase
MSSFPILDQISAGGVVYRRTGARVEVVLVAVPPTGRWQLPKGLHEAGESFETTALREVREETGLEAQIVAPLETVSYWYAGLHKGQRARFRKQVHFFLMSYGSGSVDNHDHEVMEARWVTLDAAQTLLSFQNERRIVAEAAVRITALPEEG